LSKRVGLESDYAWVTLIDTEDSNQMTDYKHATPDGVGNGSFKVRCLESSTQ